MAGRRLLGGCLPLLRHGAGRGGERLFVHPEGTGGVLRRHRERGRGRARPECDHVGGPHRTRQRRHGGQRHHVDGERLGVYGRRRHPRRGRSGPCRRDRLRDVYGGVRGQTRDHGARRAVRAVRRQLQRQPGVRRQRLGGDGQFAATALPAVTGRLGDAGPAHDARVPCLRQRRFRHAGPHDRAGRARPVEEWRAGRLFRHVEKREADRQPRDRLQQLHRRRLPWRKRRHVSAARTPRRSRCRRAGRSTRRRTS